MSVQAMALTAEDVALGLRAQGYVPLLSASQAKVLAREYGTEFKQQYPWRHYIPLDEVAAVIAVHINKLEAPNE